MPIIQRSEPDGRKKRENSESSRVLSRAIQPRRGSVICLTVILWHYDCDIELFGVRTRMPAKIYRPAKTAMQSGKAKTHKWVLEFDQDRPRVIDSIMGYTGSGDMRQQLKLSFETRELAEAYAVREGIEFRVIEPKDATRKAVSYSDNFKFSRTQPWTH